VTAQGHRRPLLSAGLAAPQEQTRKIRTAIIGVVGAIWRAVVLSRGGLNPFVAKEQLS
jgi:hypothetical protein